MAAGEATRPHRVRVLPEHDGGDFLFGPGGRPLLTAIQVAEKWYLDWKLEVVNPGGHSSRPRKDNAIYELAAALRRVEDLRFPVGIGEVVRAYFTKQAALVGGTIGADMRAAAASRPTPRPWPVSPRARSTTACSAPRASPP